MKKSLFPVHRVGEIEASRAAAILIFSLFFFFVGKYSPFLEIFSFFF